MQMSDFEIVFDFKAAKKKREQIGILAELNQCSRDKIREILLRNGISEAELPAKPGRRRAAETEVFHQQVKKNHAKTEEFRPAKQEPVAEEEVVPEEKVTMENMEELLPWPDPVVEETSEPEAVHVAATEVRHEVPESVKKACRDRIWGIIQEVAELEREKRELQGFLGESA